jgi:tetratricopeptide (TPR) repeat protein
MKSWLLSSFLLLSIAWAGPLDDANFCLDVVDLRCAIDIRDSLLQKKPNDVEVLELHARTLFHQGHYDQTVNVLVKLEEAGNLLADKAGFPARATAAAASGMIESRGTGVVVRHDPGVDRILADEAVETLLLSRSTYDSLFGAGPDHDIVMDIFPTASRFIGASGLPPEAVRTTGVIALSKWNRLLLTSPRSLAQGYSWKDTAAHEYIHLVVSWRTQDKAPVWLQEGLAKNLEKAWRGDRENYLSAHQQSLLAEALQNETFVPFEKFAKSMAYLDSGDEAALAFAQVASMIGFFNVKTGDAAFSILMDRVRNSEPPEQVVASLAGYQSFEDFKKSWKEYIASLPLVKEKLVSLPVALDGEGGDFADDPLLNNRVDLVKYVRLGDLLLDAGHPKAALIEYNKAKDGQGPPSPNVFVRKAKCYQEMNELSKALEIIEEAVKVYPEYTKILITLGALYEKSGDIGKAIQYWQEAHELNPYDISTQNALIRLYKKKGLPEKVNKHQRYAHILLKGGAIHTGDSDYAK